MRRPKHANRYDIFIKNDAVVITIANHIAQFSKKERMAICRHLVELTACEFERLIDYEICNRLIFERLINRLSD